MNDLQVDGWENNAAENPRGDNRPEEDGPAACGRSDCEDHRDRNHGSGCGNDNGNGNDDRRGGISSTFPRRRTPHRELQGQRTGGGR